MVDVGKVVALGAGAIIRELLVIDLFMALGTAIWVSLLDNKSRARH